MSVPESLSAVAPTVILASASPRRRELLARLSIPFTVMPANVDEQLRPGETPLAYVVRLAQAKAACIAQRFPEALVLGADTVVVLDRHIMGKPEDVAHARRMLARLSGQQHTVITGLALLHHSRRLRYLDSVSTRVRFRPLAAAEIEQYLASGEPFDKAGAYAIQGRAGAFVAAVEGCYTNVVGLPVQRTAALLQAAGVPVRQHPVSGAAEQP
jgi:nucleoside triphosphate pyrophosphatase